MASTANLNVISPSAGGNFTDPLWNHTAGTWLRDMGGQAALASSSPCSPGSGCAASAPAAARADGTGRVAQRFRRGTCCGGSR